MELSVASFFQNKSIEPELDQNHTILHWSENKKKNTLVMLL